MKKILLILFLLLQLLPVYAEIAHCGGTYCFDCYDSSRDLPQNQVVAFAGTSLGHMFVAGKSFLARFDGNEFLFPSGSRFGDMPTNTVNDFVSDGMGKGYIATDLGLWMTGLDAFEMLSFKNVGKVGHFDIRSLAYDRERALLYGVARGKGVFVLSGNGFLKWFSPENSHLGTKNVNKVFVDSAGTVWAGAESGVYFLREGSEKFVQIDYLDDQVSSFAEGSGNRIFAGGTDTVFVIENGEVATTLDVGKMRGVTITALESDDSGSLWVGTKNSGVFILDENGSTSRVSGAENITAFARDSEGEIWFGTAADGFCIAKRSAFKGMLFEKERVTGAASDSAGNILINTENGIFRQSYDGKWENFCGGTACMTAFNRIFFDKADNLWASAPSGLYILQPDNTFKPVSEIYSGAEDIFPASSDVFFSDSSGNVWVNDSTLHGAVFLFRSDRTAERFMLPNIYTDIVDIVEHDGKLFVVTKRSGVFEFEESGRLAPVSLWKKVVFVKRAFVDSKKRIWIVTLSDEIFISIEGDAIVLPTERLRKKAVISSVSEDKNGNFWLMTNAGIAEIKGEDTDCFLDGNCSDLPFVLYGQRDGMASRECAEGRNADAALSSQGHLFVPMMKGVALFDTNFKDENGVVPEITIERIFSPDEGGGIYSPDNIGRTVLPNTVENLTVSYSAPLFSGSGELLFDYSFDKQQVKGTTARKVALSGISSGSHEFSVRAYRSGEPSKFSEKRFTFKVNSELYEKKAVLVTTPLILVALIIVIIFLNRRIKTIRETEIKRLIEERTAELQIKNNALKEAVMKDPLTGLMNRRYMFEVEERKIRRFIESRDRKMHLRDNRNVLEKNDLVYGVMMMDIDHFKRVNDIYGHDAGDMVLKGVAEVMQDSVRADDILIRWGGEEFLIVLKNIPLEKMLEVARKIRKAIEKHSFTAQDGTTLWVTVSMGVVFLPFFVSDPKLLTFENIITLADLALYHSKENGRDMATFVVPGRNIPATQQDVNGMLGSSEFAAVNDFYTFEKIEPNNFSEFEI